MAKVIDFFVFFGCIHTDDHLNETLCTIVRSTMFGHSSGPVLLMVDHFRQTVKEV